MPQLPGVSLSSAPLASSPTLLVRAHYYKEQVCTLDYRVLGSSLGIPLSRLFFFILLRMASEDVWSKVFLTHKLSFTNWTLERERRGFSLEEVRESIKHSLSVCQLLQHSTYPGRPELSFSSFYFLFWQLLAELFERRAHSWFAPAPRYKQAKCDGQWCSIYTCTYLLYLLWSLLTLIGLLWQVLLTVLQCKYNSISQCSTTL